MLNKVHLFFEQSGTFKKEFLKLGVVAEDYDIANDFGETDHIIDLFAEIKKAYANEPSIFDTISKDDLIMAFFPCIRFEAQILIEFRGDSYGMRDWNIKDKMLYCIKLQEELTELYKLVNMLFIICYDRKLKLIMENPYSDQHYLKRYWCIKPSLIDYDRRLRGDYFQKPTQYWFLNCEPKDKLVPDCMVQNFIDCKNANRDMKKEHYIQTGAKNKKVARSMIHSDYANRFIREYIL